MKVRQKTIKLIQNPHRFFSESKHGVVRGVGKVMFPAPPPNQKKKHANKALPPAKSTAKKATLSAAEAPAHIELRKADSSLQSAIASPRLKLDPWIHYRTHNQSKANAVFAPTCILFPSGNLQWDHLLAQTCDAAGWRPLFWPLWECTTDSDLDDIEFVATRKPQLLPALVRRAMACAEALQPRAAVLPYDCTPLTRSLAIALRANDVPSAVTIMPSQWVEDKYLAEDGPSSPICERSGLFSDRTELFSQIQSLASSDFVPLAPTQPDPTRTRPESKARGQLGIGPQDDLILVVGPSRTFAEQDDAVRARLDALINYVTPRLDDRSHLVLVLPPKKGGYLSKAANSKLSSFYRKTILVHGERSNLNSLAEAANHIFVYDAGDAAAFREYGAEVRTSEDLNQQAKVRPASFGSQFLPKQGDELGTDPSQDAPQESGVDLRGFVHDFLSSVSETTPLKTSLENKLELIARIKNPARRAFDVIAVPDPPSNRAIAEGRQRHLNDLLNCNRRIHGAGGPSQLPLAEIFVQWGAEPNEPKSRPEIARTNLARPKLYLEDGFVRSIGLWTDVAEPSYSVLMDTDAVYYDATRSSLFEQILNSDWKLSDVERARARELIARIVSERISKYNYAPRIPVDLVEGDRRRILLVDQKAGDMSLKYGLANEASFRRMLDEAKALGDKADFIIKQHPCAITGGEDHAHYTEESLGSFAEQDNVQLVCFDINPYCLMQDIDEVWVVSSGMGFEALMAGKKVRCFGAPFYSQWGLTQDEIKVERRTKARSLEEVFHVAYLWLTQYVDPEAGSPCELERLIDFICENRWVETDAA